ncbi:MAG: hypothetical protein ACYDA2_09075 [Acidimicrobiales bacterium]
MSSGPPRRPFWRRRRESGRTAEEDPGAPFMNDTNKYVVSSTLTETSCTSSSIR